MNLDKLQDKANKLILIANNSIDEAIIPDEINNAIQELNFTIESENSSTSSYFLGIKKLKSLLALNDKYLPKKEIGKIYRLVSKNNKDTFDGDLNNWYVTETEKLNQNLHTERHPVQQQHEEETTEEKIEEEFTIDMNISENKIENKKESILKIDTENLNKERLFKKIVSSNIKLKSKEVKEFKNIYHCLEQYHKYGKDVNSINYNTVMDTLNYTDNMENVSDKEIHELYIERKHLFIEFSKRYISIPDEMKTHVTLINKLKINDLESHHSVLDRTEEKISEIKGNIYNLHNEFKKLEENLKKISPFSQIKKNSFFKQSSIIYLLGSLLFTSSFFNIYLFMENNNLISIITNK